MNPYRMARPPRRWKPKLSPWVVRLTKRLRKWQGLKTCQLEGVEIQNAEIVKEQIRQGNGVLITPNHSSHADPFSMNAAADATGFPMYFMATWHVFESQGKIGQWLLQKHGAFSIDREGTDMEAMKTAQNILQEKKYPLVIFPEGEVYHTNDHVTPFREGAAALAYLSARRADRKIVCIPTALKYWYTSDPMPELLDLLVELESSIHWRPTPEKPMVERIYRIGSALMALKELEHLDSVQEGTLPERTERLADHILSVNEEQLEIDAGDKMLPERVKQLRNEVITQLESIEPSDENKRAELDHYLDDVFLAVQLFSYPGSYVSDNPTVERIAETLDKLEEEVLNKYSASIRATRKSLVRFGDPIEVISEKRRNYASELTDQLRNTVQSMIDDINANYSED